MWQGFYSKHNVNSGMERVQARIRQLSTLTRAGEEVELSLQLGEVLPAQLAPDLMNDTHAMYLLDADAAEPITEVGDDHACEQIADQLSHVADSVHRVVCDLNLS